jgi:hypothetical protein
VKTCRICDASKKTHRVRSLCNGYLLTFRACDDCESYLRANHPNIYSRGERIPKVLRDLARR